MNEFFDSLKEEMNAEEALKIFKNRVLKKKLSLQAGNKSYEECKKEFDELSKLQEIYDLLRKIK
ncbi:hypothetical protein NUSPORA_02232 [Nucleospora cyclopteri]